jgi:hypothetical protein
MYKLRRICFRSHIFKKIIKKLSYEVKEKQEDLKSGENYLLLSILIDNYQLVDKRLLSILIDNNLSKATLLSPARLRPQFYQQTPL